MSYKMANLAQVYTRNTELVVSLVVVHEKTKTVVYQIYSYWHRHISYIDR